MSETRRAEAERLARRLNSYFHALFGGWLGITTVFWLQLCGPLRDDVPQPLPVLAWFVGSVAAGFSCYLLPSKYYAIGKPDRTIRFYKSIGILGLRRWITDGDQVREMVRRIDPTYVVDGHKRSMAERLALTRNIERAHFGFLFFGIASGTCAAMYGWWGWASAITIGNVAANLLPAMLQRYTRARISRILSRGASTAVP